MAAQIDTKGALVDVATSEVEREFLTLLRQTGADDRGRIAKLLWAGQNELLPTPDVAAGMSAAAVRAFADAFPDRLQ